MTTHWCVFFFLSRHCTPDTDVFFLSKHQSEWILPQAKFLPFLFQTLTHTQPYIQYITHNIQIWVCSFNYIFFPSLPNCFHRDVSNFQHYHYCYSPFHSILEYYGFTLAQPVSLFLPVSLDPHMLIWPKGPPLLIPYSNRVLNRN